MGVESLLEPLIVSRNHTVCLVGGARVSAQVISSILPIVDQFVAVDSGADHLLAAGITPAVVVGDLDSISDHARATFAGRLHPIAEQSTTDFEKALSRVEAPMVIALGFTGGRMDHVLAVLNVLARYQSRAIILLDDTDLCFVARAGETRIAPPVGTRMSLMPLAACRVTATGLRWSFSDQDMQPTGFISSSNEVAGPITVQTDGPLLITMPAALLSLAQKAALRE
ncbi:thiamine diphosphokinase [Loktanella sp. D2R18]|uniref:thiamine diphosphokinase n=1 Tax=Rhodobacterales TaxID=204455 RepID=UPI000DE9FB91|nr:MULTISPECIES: thiamine diphosphokinase [Rhodobacterales]MDO6591701.1 thiamine diphosphokinase [Yoonia sp. 1_MG-2023]RBW42526.1 thiamine diphosphokinase [Loktanella sp. D2R18]